MAFPSPPVPAPGPALLDDNESRFLDNFFDGVSTDQFGGDFFATGGEGLDDASFWQELPPTFMGTTSSFGPPQPPNPTNDVTPFGYTSLSLGLDSTAGQQASAATADVIAAANVLQNGHRGAHVAVDNPLLAAQDFSQSLVPPHTRQNLSSTSFERGRPGSLPSRQDPNFGPPFYTDTPWGPAAGSAQPPSRHPTKGVDIRWGSDASFGAGQGFIAPPGQVSVDTIEQHLIDVVKQAAAERSTADSPAANSPVAFRQPESMRSNHNLTNGQMMEDDEGNLRPKKRRKSKTNDEEDEDGDGAFSKMPRKRRPKSYGGPATVAETESSPASKRRKSGTTPAKPPRENLTEDQKRENHIRSEQKRRTLIKEGFDDLNELVPALQGGGHSKSVVLVLAGEWLENLIEGNKVLRAQLQELEGNLQAHVKQE